MARTAPGRLTATPDNPVAAGARRDRTEEETRIVGLERSKPTADVTAVAPRAAAATARRAMRALVPLAAAGALLAAAPAQAQDRAIEAVSPIESGGQNVHHAYSWGTLSGDAAVYRQSEAGTEITVARRSPTGWRQQTFFAHDVGNTLFTSDVSPDGARLVSNEPPVSGRGGLYFIENGERTPIVQWNDGDPEPDYLGASYDVRHLVVRAPDGAFPGPSSTTGLYRWTRANGAEPIDIDMSRYDGVTCSGVNARPAIGDRQPLGRPGISDDGRTIAVTTPTCAGVVGHIAVWRDGTSTDITVPVAGAPDLQPTYYGMRRDGSRVYFGSGAKLEPGDDNGAFDLYVWEDGTLRRITDGGVETAQVAVSSDGTTVWFRTNQPIGGVGEAGQRNVWVWDGELSLVGTYAPADAPNIEGHLSEDGRFLLFVSQRDPDTGTNYGQNQVQRLGRDGGVACASCPPSGVTVAAATLGNNANHRVSAQPRISRDGRLVVFETTMALDPRDVNGTIDVYAWEDGEQKLISSGTSAGWSQYRGMTHDGTSVFFYEDGVVLPGTTDPYVKLYVWRVGGGFPSAVGDEPCGMGCQTRTPLPPAPPLAASVTFAGPGNLPPQPRSRTGREGAQAQSSRAQVTSPSKAVRGRSALVRVKVPGAGSIRVTGARIANVSRTVRKAGTYRIRVRLSKRYQRSLARRGKVTAALRVQFRPEDGDASARTVRLTFQRPARRGR